MAYEELCMYCFEDRGGDPVCPHCGRDSRAAVPQIQMLPGSLVYNDRFLVGRAMGQDATGIVYAAYDTKRGNRIRIREYLPRDCAERLTDGDVVPKAGMEDAFEKGMRKLQASVEGVEDPSRRHFYFEENGTAYIAQRKNGAAEAAAGAEDDEEGGRRRVGLIIGIAVAVLAAAVLGLVLLFNRLFNPDDVTADPTLSPSASAQTNVWAPAATPSPTPYVSPTFAALVDPEQSWMDYTYSGDVEADYANQTRQSTSGWLTATAAPTLQPSAQQYTGTVSRKSSAGQITALQQRLAALGWLSSGKVTGSYDADTVQAVRDFQNYINSAVQPSEKLTVDGIAGPKTQQWLYGINAARPTPTPTPAVTPDPAQTITVDKNSSRTDIRAVQRKLITLGLMESGSDDGVYGNTTTAAVKKFQQRVNQLQGYNALSVTGVVDPDTMAYLNYYIEWWENLQSATATPEPVLPSTATPVPTAAPTDIPDQPETGVTVNKDSPVESIRYLQQQLIQVGLLPAGSADGVYGTSTVAAVTRFQEWVNSVSGFGTVAINGTADAQTQQYLEYAVAKNMVAPTAAPTAVPTEVPTAAPTGVPTEVPTAVPTGAPTAAPTDVPDVPEDNFAVDRDSPVESIQYLQQMLIEVGLLPAGSDDGVYGSGTAAAVAAFQQWVNAQQGGAVLTVSGTADAQTLEYLDYAVSNGVTAAATAAPTAEPTAAPVVPVSLALDVQGAVYNSAGGGGFMVNGSTVTFRWSASGAVDAYYVYVTDANGGAFYTEEATDRTQISFGSSELAANMIYTLRVDVLPANGGESDITTQMVRFARFVQDAPAQAPTAAPTAAPTEVPAAVPTEAPAAVPTEVPTAVPTEVPTPVPTEAPTEAPDEDVTVGPGSAAESVAYLQQELIALGLLPQGSADGNYGEATAQAVRSFQQMFNSAAQGRVALDITGTADALTLQAIEFALGQGWRAPTPVPTQPPTPEPTATPEPTPEPTATPVPTEVPTPAPGRIESLSLWINGEQPNGIVVMSGDTITFNWAASGNVQGYTVTLTDNAGNTKTLVSNSAQTSGGLRKSDLRAGDVYTITVAAIPTNNGDIAWVDARFSVPAEGAPTPAPVVQASEPRISIDGVKTLVDGVETLTGDTAIFSWQSEGDVQGYVLRLVRTTADGEAELSTETTAGTSKTVSLADLGAGTYALYVGAVTAGASQDSAAWNRILFAVSGS